MVCEKCWYGTGKSQYQCYLELLQERKGNPCPPEAQSNNGLQATGATGGLSDGETPAPAPDASRWVDTMRITIIQKGLRESGSSGDGVWVADQQLWFVTLDRASPPFRGYYAASEVDVQMPAKPPLVADENNTHG